MARDVRNASAPPRITAHCAHERDVDSFSGLEHTNQRVSKYEFLADTYVDPEVFA